MGYIFGTNTVSDISKFTKITPAVHVKHPVILKFTLFESKANIYPQRPADTTRYILESKLYFWHTSIIFKCGGNTSYLRQSHFQNFSACSINIVYIIFELSLKFVLCDAVIIIITDFLHHSLVFKL